MSCKRAHRATNRSALRISSWELAAGRDILLPASYPSSENRFIATPHGTRRLAKKQCHPSAEGSAFSDLLCELCVLCVLCVNLLFFPSRWARHFFSSPHSFSHGTLIPCVDFPRCHTRSARSAPYSCRTTVSNDLLTLIFPLYSMNPSFRNLFMKKFTRERVVPTMLASVSCETFGSTLSGCSFCP